MSYIKSHLQEGEQLVYTTKVHWIVYLRPALWAVLAIAAYLYATRMTGASYGTTLRWAAALFALIAVLDWLRALVRRMSTELSVTDRRVVSKTGIIRQSTVEMNRSKIESVLVEQNIIGRIFDFGTITIKGTGGGTEPLASLAGPAKFRSHVTAG